MYTDGISPIIQSHLAGSRKLEGPAEVQDKELREVCCEFEAVLTSQLLKEGMKSGQALGNEEDDKGSEMFKEMAFEQIAYFVGRQGVLGIADHITESIRQK